MHGFTEYARAPTFADVGSRDGGDNLRLRGLKLNAKGHFGWGVQQGVEAQA